MTDWEAKLFLSHRTLHQLVQGHREYCETFLPPESRLQISSQWGHSWWGEGESMTPGHQESWQEGGRTWRLFVGLLEELLAGGREEQAVGCQEKGMTLSRWGLLKGRGGREGICLLGVAQDLRPGSKAGWEDSCLWLGGCWRPGGKKDTGPGSGASCRPDCLPPGGRLVNGIPPFFVSIDEHILPFSWNTTRLTIITLVVKKFSVDIHMDPLYTFMCVALANWIYVIIQVEKTFRAVQCQRCGNIFQWKVGIRKHLQKTHMFFFGFV